MKAHKFYDNAVFTQRQLNQTINTPGLCDLAIKIG